MGASANSSRLWVVTGAAGFLGNNVVRELLAKGESVRAAVYMGQEHAVQTPPAIPPSDKTFPPPHHAQTRYPRRLSTSKMMRTWGLFE